MLNTRALFEPLRYSPSFLASGTLNTRMTVPLSEAVASMVPCELIAMAAMGYLCAWIMLTAVRVIVSNINIEPIDEDCEGPGGWFDKGEEAVGTGAG